MTINKKPAGKKLRSSVMRGFAKKSEGAGSHGEGRVDREKRIIYGYSVATVGEALGHGMELDHTSLDQLVELEKQAPKGIKARFTHPDMSNDGMGKFLGRTKNYRRVGDQVLGDLHLAKASHTSPQGDLGTYVMDLAEEDPEAFGTSVVVLVETEYRREADGTLTKGEDGEPLLPLARFHALHASDVVDDPAANPGGMFARFSEKRDPAAFVSATLDRLFGNLPQDEVRERCEAYLDRYFTNRNEPPTDEREAPMPQENTKPADNGTPNTDAAELSKREQELAEREANLKKAEADQKAKAERFAAEQEIRALCNQVGSPNVEAYLSANLSVAEVKDKLIEERAKEHSLSTKIGNDTGDGKEKEKDPAAPYRKEYQASQAMFSRLGVSENDYIASRQIDAAGGEIAVAPAE